MASLIDGTEVASDSEAWKLECLARHILTLPRPERTAWLADWRERKGDAAWERLATLITEIHGRNIEQRVT